MPVWATSILIKFVLPLIIQYAVKHNMIGELTASLARFGLELKTYHEPEDFPSAPPGQTNISNINRS